LLQKRKATTSKDAGHRRKTTIEPKRTMTMSIREMEGGGHVDKCVEGRQGEGHA
jgi:hypothetical protein